MGLRVFGNHCLILDEVVNLSFKDLLDFFGVVALVDAIENQTVFPDVHLPLLFRFTLGTVSVLVLVGGLLLLVHYYLQMLEHQMENKQDQSRPQIVSIVCAVRLPSLLNVNQRSHCEPLQDGGEEDLGVVVGRRNVNPNDWDVAQTHHQKQDGRVL